MRKIYIHLMTLLLVTSLVIDAGAAHCLPACRVRNVSLASQAINPQLIAAYRGPQGSVAICREATKSPLFVGMETNEFQDIIAAALPRNFNAEEILFFQGLQASCIYLVVRGLAKNTLLHESLNGPIIRLSGAGEVLGVEALGPTSEKSYAFEGEAIEPLATVYWDIELFERLLKRFPRLRENLARMMHRNLEALSEHFLNLAKHTAPIRLAIALEQSVRYFESSENAYSVRLGNKVLAGLSGITPSTISRLFTKWKEQGIIRKTVEEVTFRDPKSLLKEVEQHHLADNPEARLLTGQAELELSQVMRNRPARFMLDRELRDLPPFAGLKSAEIDDIFARGQKWDAPNGIALFSQGRPVSHVILVRSGVVELFRTDLNKKQNLLTVRGAGTFLGGADAMFSADGTNLYSGLTSGKLKAYVWDVDLFRQLCAQYPRLLGNLMEPMQQDLTELAGRLLELVSQSVPLRLASLLTRLTSHYASINGIFTIYQTDAQLAQLIGTSGTTLNRTISQWKATGRVLHGRGFVKVRDPGTLIQMAVRIKNGFAAENGHQPRRATLGAS